MVFVIHNRQSRDTQEMELKLDELIRVNEVARNSLSIRRKCPDADVERMTAAFATLATRENVTRLSGHF